MSAQFQDRSEDKHDVWNTENALPSREGEMHRENKSARNIGNTYKGVQPTQMELKALSVHRGNQRDGILRTNRVRGRERGVISRHRTRKITLNACK